MQAELGQKKCDLVMREFRCSSSRALNFTDLLAREIDLQQVSLVINFDLLSNMENHSHRIERFGKKSIAINFVPNNCTCSMKDIVSRTSFGNLRNESHDQTHHICSVGKRNWFVIQIHVVRSNDEFESAHEAIIWKERREHSDVSLLVNRENPIAIHQCLEALERVLKRSANKHGALEKKHDAHSNHHSALLDQWKAAKEVQTGPRHKSIADLYLAVEAHSMKRVKGDAMKTNEEIREFECFKMFLIFWQSIMRRTKQKPVSDSVV